MLFFWEGLVCWLQGDIQTAQWSCRYVYKAVGYRRILGLPRNIWFVEYIFVYVACAHCIVFSWFIQGLSFKTVPCLYRFHELQIRNTYLAQVPWFYKVGLLQRNIQLAQYLVEKGSPIFTTLKQDENNKPDTFLHHVAETSLQVQNGDPNSVITFLTKTVPTTSSCYPFVFFYFCLALPKSCLCVCLYKIYVSVYFFYYFFFISQSWI